MALATPMFNDKFWRVSGTRRHPRAKRPL